MNKAQKLIWTGYLLLIILGLIRVADTGYNHLQLIRITIAIGWVPFLFAHFIWREKSSVKVSTDKSSVVKKPFWSLLINGYSRNKKKNIITIIMVVFLFLALQESWPYGFFTLLRIIVFSGTAYLTWITYKAQIKKWAYTFGFIAYLFNPLIPVQLNHELWSILDLVVGVILIVSIFYLKFGDKNYQSTS